MRLLLPYGRGLAVAAILLLPFSALTAGILAADSFTGAAGPLHGYSGGTGWASPWEVQNSSVGVPGYNLADTTPFTGPVVTPSGNYARGGSAWLSSGRALDTSAGGSFAPYLEAGLIGKAKQTLYLGVLLRKDVDSADDLWVTLHAGTNPAWYAASPGVAVGYFGGPSDANGVRYWSLKLQGSVYRSHVPVLVGQAAFLMVKVTFGSRNTVALYVNPPVTGLPASPSASGATNASVAFRSVVWYGGSGASQASLDEIRIGTEYAALVAGGSQPPFPPANVSALPGNGQVSLSWTAAAGAASYQIYQTVNAVQLAGTSATPGFLASGLTNRTFYTFQIKSVNPAGSSAFSTPVTVVPRGPSPAPVPILGSNLNQFNDYSRELALVDAFKTARPWIPQAQGLPWGQGPALSLDPNGWIRSLQPGQYAETIMMDNALNDSAHYPAGEYTLLYDGKGKISFDLNSASIVSEAPGRMVVNVPAGNTGVFLIESETDATDPLRNIRFIMPGFEATWQHQPFHPQFLARLQGYKALRFMETMWTNGSTQQNWSERPLVTDYTYGWRGMPLELLAKLANTLNVTPWFNVPAMATDDYMLQFSLLLKEQLSPTLRFYLEYSNETWNGSFSQHDWIAAQGQALGFSSDPVVAAAYYTGWRSVQMFRTFETTFGGTSRLIRVIASFSGNAWLSDQTLGFQNVFASADVLAIAPYFNCDDRPTGGFGVLGDPATADQVAAMTVDQVIDIQLAHINGCSAREIQSNSTVAGKYGLRMVAYEGGQSLVGSNGAENNAALTALFAAANRNPRMSSLYNQYLQNWVNAGGDLFVHYSNVTAYTKYGNWGALEYADQQVNTAPKYQALMNFASQH